ncbi:MAG: hypothetical protein ACHQ1H_01625 [Nitrososphaerales archaeon]
MVGVFKVIALVLIPVIVGSVGYGVYITQNASIDSFVSTNRTNSSAFSTFSQSQSAITGASNSSSIHIPPVPNNGTLIQSLVMCANFSVPYIPIAYSGTTFVTVGSGNVAANYTQMLIVEVLCNGCAGPQSYNKTYTQWPANTPLQWNGTITNSEDNPHSQPFGGVCDMSRGLSRFSSLPWKVSWDFKNLTPTGTLEIKTLLDSSPNNRTVIFDKSSSVPYGEVSGNTTIL